MDLALPREYAGETGTHSTLQDRIADLEKELLANEEKYEETQTKGHILPIVLGLPTSPECPEKNNRDLAPGPLCIVV